MQIRKKLFLGSCLVSFVLAGECVLRAQSTWIGTNDQLASGFAEWTDAVNWTAGTVPAANTPTLIGATLGRTTISFNATVAPASATARAQNVTIQSSALSHTFGTTGLLADPGILNIGNSGQVGFLTNQSANNQSFVAAVRFASAASTRQINNTAAGLMTFSRAITTGTPTTTTTSSLNISNTSATGGGLTFNGAVSVGDVSISNTGAGNVSFGSSGALTATGLTVNNSSAGSVVFSGAVSRGTGALNVTNNGSGIVSFNGAVNGSGAISTSGTGTVRLGSSGNLNGAVTVGGGGRFDGVGTVTGAVTLNNATFAPGSGLNQVGTLSINTTGTGLTANNGSIFEFDLRSSSNDNINMNNSSLNLFADGSQITVRANLLDPLTIGSGETVSWNIFTGVFNAGSIDLAKLTVDTVAGATINGAAATADQFFWSVTGGNTLTLSAVPEPSSMALVGLVGVGAAGFARRRMKKDVKKESV